MTIVSPLTSGLSTATLGAAASAAAFRLAGKTPFTKGMTHAQIVGTAAFAFLTAAAYSGKKELALIGELTMGAYFLFLWAALRLSAGTSHRGGMRPACYLAAASCVFTAFGAYAPALIVMAIAGAVMSLTHLFSRDTKRDSAVEKAFNFGIGASSGLAAAGMFLLGMAIIPTVRDPLATAHDPLVMIGGGFFALGGLTMAGTELVIIFIRLQKKEPFAKEAILMIGALAGAAAAYYLVTPALVPLLRSIV